MQLIQITSNIPKRDGLKIAPLTIFFIAINSKDNFLIMLNIIFNVI